MRLKGAKKVFGTLSGAAMLVFLFALLLAVLERAGAVRKQTAHALLKTVLICVGFGLAFDGAARLMFALLYDTDGAPGVWELYGTGWLQPYLTGVETGGGLLGLPGHALGRLFFGEYLMGGVVFSALLTVTALHLIYLRLRALFGESAARAGQALALAFPGSFLCFLPGWAAWALSGTALTFYLMGDRLKRFAWPKDEWTAPASEALFAVLAVLNALLLLLTVMKKLG